MGFSQPQYESVSVDRLEILIHLLWVKVSYILMCFVSLQSMVGDKTFSFLLMDKEMYFNMSTQQPANLIVDRGIALHKVEPSYLKLSTRVSLLRVCLFLGHWIWVWLAKFINADDSLYYNGSRRGRLLEFHGQRGKYFDTNFSTRHSSCPFSRV